MRYLESRRENQRWIEKQVNWHGDSCNPQERKAVVEVCQKPRVNYCNPAASVNIHLICPLNYI